MKIFVVIPLFNEEKHVVKLLKDLLPYKLTIVVVDDGSSDDSRFKILNSGMLSFLSTKLIWGRARP